MYISSQAVELLICNLWSFRHVTPVKTHLLETAIHSTKFNLEIPFRNVTIHNSKDCLSVTQAMPKAKSVSA
jgi:hypothetical protein